MKFDFQLPEYPDSTFVLEVSALTGKRKIYKDGALLSQVKTTKDNPYEIENRLSDNTLIYLKPAFPDIAPKMIINGKEIAYVEKLQWWEYAIACIPLALIFAGGFIGGGIGAGAWMLNMYILRQPLPAGKKYGFIILNIIIAITLALILSVIVVRMLGQAS